MKTNILKIGITGGIGAGKTIVTQVFALLGIPVYYADERAKYILHNDQEVSREIRNQFGERAYSDGKLDTGFISAEVFNNQEKLVKLNSIVHPKVAIDFENWLKVQTSVYILKEAALLYESGAYKGLDKIITVFSPVELRIKRTLLRDPQRTEADVRAIIQKQMTDDEKVKRADYVIDNDDRQLVVPQVLKLHEQFLTECASL